MRDRARRAGDDAKGPRRARGDDADDDPDFSVGGGGSRKHRARGAPAAKSGGGGGGPSTSGGGGSGGQQQEREQPDHMQIDPAALAAAAAAAGEEAVGAVDPALLSAIVAAGGAQAIGIGPDGQPVALDISGAGLQQLEGLQVAAGGLYAVDAMGAGALVQPLAPLANQFAAPDALASEGIKRGDLESVAAARRAGTLVTVHYNLEMSEELEDADIGVQQGSVEVPQSADVSQLKRLLWYKGMNILLPGCQVLISEDGREMEEADEGGLPMSISAYGVTDGSTITLRVVVPDDIDTIPLVDEAIVSAAYSAGKLVLHRGGGGGGGGGSAASRKTRWTEDQIEALIDGVERHGLSAWKTIVQDPRLSGKNNMQCKDKFRNLCLTIIQGRPERGLTLDWTLKDRVRKLIDQESIQF